MNENADRVARLLGRHQIAEAEALIASLADQPIDQALAHTIAALYQKDVAAAVGHATRAVAAGGGADAEHLLATAYLASGDGDAALAHARKGVAADGGPRSRSSLAGVLLGLRRFSDAAALLRQIASEEPKNHDVQLNLGIAAGQSGDYGGAITAFSRAFDLEPHDRRPLDYLMTMFGEIGRPMGALAALDLSRRDDQPGEISVLFGLATIHLFKQIAARFPGPGIAKDPDEAVKRLMVDAIQRSPAVQLVAARTLADAGRLDEAKQLADRLDKIVVEPTERAGVLYLRGYLAEHARDRVGALAAYEEALATDPTRADAAANAISVLLEDGSPAAFAKVQHLLDTVSPLHRARPELMFNESIYLARAGRIAEAKSKLQGLVDALPADHKLAELATQALSELTGKPS